jgi:hypothetical protein
VAAVKKKESFNFSTFIHRQRPICTQCTPYWAAIISSGISEFVIVLYGEEIRRELLIPSLILSAVQVGLLLGFPLCFGDWVWLVQAGFNSVL